MADLDQDGRTAFPNAPDISAAWAANCFERGLMAVQHMWAPDSDGIEFPDPAQVEQECLAEGPGNRSLEQIQQDTMGMQKLFRTRIGMKIDA